jgi:hypothetical protein
MAGLCGNANNWLVFGLELPYWDPKGKSLEQYNPFLHLWSLGVEEQFYFVLPFLLRVTSWSFSGFMSLLVLVSVASLAISGYWSLRGPIEQMYAFYLLPSRFWELALGVILACVQEQVCELLSKRDTAVYCLDFLAAATLCASLVITPIEQGFPFPWALLSTASACLCIIVGMPKQKSVLSKVLGSRVPAYIGSISYSMYLWHTPILACLAWVDGSMRRSVSGCMLCGAIAIVLSIASFHSVENPIRRLRPRSVTTFSVSFVALAMSVAWLQMFRTTSNPTNLTLHESSGGVLNEQVCHLKDSLVCSQCWCRVKAHAEHQPVTESNESDVAPCFESHKTTDLGYTFPEITVAYGGTCFPQYPATFNASIVRRCLAEHSEPTIYLVGDSHSLPTRFAVAKVVLPGHQFEVFATPSSNFRDHKDFYQTIVDRLKQVLKPSDLVVVHERLDVCDGFCTSADDFERRLTMLLEVCEKSKTKVLMLGDNVLLPEIPNTCVMEGNSDLCKTSMEHQLSLQEAKRKVIARMVNSHSGIAFFWDQLPLFCSKDGTCLATVPGTSTRAYFDITHNNQWGATYMWPFLCRFMETHKLMLGNKGGPKLV